jgi:hypothetical protein
MSKPKQLALTNSTSPAQRNGAHGSHASRARAKRLARWQAAFIQALRKAPNVAHACRMAKISRFTAYKFREADETFAQRWEAALSASVDRCEEKAFDMAWKGDSQLLQFILKAHRPDRYRETARLEVDQRLCGVILLPEKEQKDP